MPLDLEEVTWNALCQLLYAYFPVKPEARHIVAGNIEEHWL